MEQPTPTSIDNVQPQVLHLSNILFLIICIFYFIFLYYYFLRIRQRRYQLITILAPNKNIVLNVDQQIHTLRVRIFEILFQLQFFPALLSSNFILIFIANLIFNRDQSKLIILIGSPYTLLLSIDLKMSQIALEHGVILSTFWQDRNESLIRDIQELQPSNDERVNQALINAQVTEDQFLLVE